MEYGFLLLVVCIVAFIRFYLLAGAAEGGKPKAELSAFDYKHEEEVERKKGLPSSLRLRAVHRDIPAEKVPENKEIKRQEPVEEKKTVQDTKPTQETKPTQDIKPTQEIKAAPAQQVPPAHQQQEQKTEPKLAEDIKEEIKEELERADEVEEEEEDEEDEDEEEEEDEEEDEEKDLHEVLNSTSVEGSIIAGSASLQGARPKNEDRTIIDVQPKISVFGVFDGHDGKQASEYCAKYMAKNIRTQKSFPASISKALIQGFCKTDKKFLDKAESGGSTAIVAVLKQDEDTVLYVANAGDSRCIASVAGNAVPLSVDHKPDLPAEQERIEATGSHDVQQSVEIVQGKRVKISRIDGTLAVSRAIGDSDFKDAPDKSQSEQAVSPVPEIQTVVLTPQHEFIVLACDGLWDVLSNQEVVDFVKGKLTSNTTPDELAAIAKALVSHAIDDKHSTDNVTALIVKL